jgi:hypothetical protein
MKFLPRVCDPSLFSRLPGTQFPVKSNACAVEIKIKWIKRKQMTHENTYRDDTHCFVNFYI